MEPVIQKIGRVYYRLEFVILDIDTTYYFFEDDYTETQFIMNHSLDKGKKVFNTISNFHDRKKDNPKMVLKLKLVDANHCPGSCMFLFWIYELTNKGEISKPHLYIYTGDYCLTSDLESKLLSLRKSEDVKEVTIVNDNTRESEVDYGVKTDDEALAKMKDFIEFHRKRCNALITVKIGADWGMEDLWIKLARQYNTSLYVSKNRYNEILNCMGRNNKKYIKERPEDGVGKVQDVEVKVRYVIFEDYKD